MARQKVEVWALDCETDPFRKDRPEPLPFLWGAYCKAAGRYETFGHGAFVIDFFRERRAVVYAHNGGRFDFHYLREGFESESPILVINGRIAKFRVGRCEFRDSYSILPVPLAAYQKESIDYGIFEPAVRAIPENARRIEEYLKSDCMNLAELLDKFFARFGRPLTQAGCAMNYWVKHYNRGVKPRQSPAQFERYKPYYFGGRVECFAAGYEECAFTVVDKNSAYPDAMMKEHPAVGEAALLSDIPSDIERCLVCFNGVSRGALPYRLDNGALEFPRDGVARDYWVTGWELEAGLELGLVRINAVHEVHLFSETLNFAGYIEEFYRERLRAKADGDRAGDLFAKLLMNSCYGKFASDPSRYSDFVLCTPQRLAALVGEGWKVYQPWGDGRWLLHAPQPEARHWYYNIATAASITGFVRAGLLRSLAQVEHPLYCDTDSIAAQRVTKLPQGNKLGEWKIELECDAYAIAGKKTYAFRSAYDQGWNAEKQIYDYPKGEYKVACKGVDLTAAEICRIAQGETFVFEPEVPTYSILRPKPVLINRVITRTAKVA